MSRFLKTPDDPVVIYNLSAADFNTITANGFGEIDNDGGEILHTPIGTIPQNGSGAQGPSNWLLINNNVYGINWQIACQGQGGETNDMYFRSGTAGAWNAWKKLLANDVSARLAAKTTNQTVINYSVPGTTAAMFNASVNLNLNTLSVGGIQVLIAFTDRNNVSQSLLFYSNAIGDFVINSTGPAGFSPMTIEALGGTSIQITTELSTGSDLSYDITASLTFIS